ncbi:MAG: zf-HC2 domain-containing protein [Acidobacteria bacterium]|nr:zf-HC2 domain-containing protein [Acidobacteriota bacterium]
MTVCLNEETIQAYIDGELAPDVAAAILTHLNACMACAAFARDLEQAVVLINSALDDELPDNVPSLRLRARMDDALAQSLKSAVPGHSFARRLYYLVSGRLQVGELSPLRLGLAVAVVIGVVILAGGLVSNFWRSDTTEQKKEFVQGLPPAQTPAPYQVQRPGDGGKHVKRQIAHRIKRESIQIEQAKTVSLARHTKTVRNTLRNPETSEHLMQTQLLLRSFRNTSTDNAEAAFDLAYEKRLSRELLSKNRLFRRSAENKEDSQATELLSQIEPLLLDIANLPDKPSQDEVLLIKELMREQKIIATLQIYTAKTGF